LAFLIAATLGLLLTIQINYRLEWSFVEKALNWHVNFGIALSIVAIVHLTWHLDYYIDMFRPVRKLKKNTYPGENKIQDHHKNLKLLILLSGFVATVIQVLLIREISTVFQGNELLMGWTIGAWMLFTGTGALLGRKQNRKNVTNTALKTVLILIGILPVCFVIIMNVFKNTIFPPGVLINPAHFLMILIFILSPIGILSGFLFAILVKMNQKEQKGYIKVYAFEAIGSLVGGLMVSLLLINWFSILQSLLVVILMMLITLFFYYRKRIWLISGGIAILVIFLSFLYPYDRYLKSFLFINQKVINSIETFYGNLTITENADQYNIYENGILSFTTDNIIIREEYVHYALLQRTHPEKILLVGGGISGMLSEILKYPSVSSIDYVELNPQMIRTVSKYIPFPENKKINMIYGDGRKFLQNTASKYDIILFAIPDPSSLQANRFYTDEFVRSVKRKLNPDAVVLISHSPAGNYIDSETAKIEGSVYHTLKNNFQNVKIIPGENDYFLASDSEINIQVSKLSEERSIENTYVNPYYIDDNSIIERSRYIEKYIISQNIINSDKKPLPVFFHTLKFLSQFNQKNFFYLLFPIIILILPVFFMRSVSVGIFAAGFTGSAIELLLIFSFQTFYGYVYSALGLIIAVFMGGLAAGSIFGSRLKITRNHFIIAQGLLLAYALLFPIFWDLQTVLKAGFFQLFIFFSITFLLALIVGFQYVAGTSIYKSEITRAATTLYGADLLGSALGVITITLILLPFLGMERSCLVIAGLNIGAIVLNLFRKT
jgi:spermidine synthase